MIAKASTRSVTGPREQSGAERTGDRAVGDGAGGSRRATYDLRPGLSSTSAAPDVQRRDTYSGMFPRLPSYAVNSSAGGLARRGTYPMSPVSSGGVRVPGGGVNQSQPTSRGVKTTSPFWMAKTQVEDFSYRSFYSVLPTANRYIESKEYALVKALQRRRLKQVAAVVVTSDRRPSSPNSHRKGASRANNSESLSGNGENGDNNQPDEAKAHYGQREGFDKFKYSKYFRRRLRENEICHQNKVLLERLMKREPMISDRNLKSSWQKVTEYQTNIRKYPPGYWTPKIGDHASDATEEERGGKGFVAASWVSNRKIGCTPINVWTHPNASPLSLLEKATVELEQLRRGDAPFGRKHVPGIGRLLPKE